MMKLNIKLNNKREAFSLTVAIAVMIIMATVGVLVMDTSGKIVRATTTQYQKEQAAILAKSYTELAVLGVMSHDRNATTDCLEDISGIVGADQAAVDKGEGYQVDVKIFYMGSNDNVKDCSGDPGDANSRTYDNNVTTVDSSLYIIVDTYVKYRDPDAAAVLKLANPGHPRNPPWITYHRRTLQKI
jgi:type II secretory pathway pseudopilin PulG